MSLEQYYTFLLHFFAKAELFVKFFSDISAFGLRC